MKIKPISIIIILFAALGALQPTRAFSTDGNDTFYANLSEVVRRVEHLATKKENNQEIAVLVPDGTAFFTNYKDKVFVVTARHVISDKYNLLMRVQAESAAKTNHTLLLELPKDKWVFHQDAGDKETFPVDVAVMKISSVGSHVYRGFYYAPQDANSQFSESDPEPPESIYLFGFPGDIGFELLEQRPFGRFGIIAMKTGKKFLKIKDRKDNRDKFLDERSIVVDTKSFPGNSGSPIFSMSGGKPKLMGLLSASDERYGYAIMVPVSRIKEVLEIAIKQPVVQPEYIELTN